MTIVLPSRRFPIAEAMARRALRLNEGIRERIADVPVTFVCI